MAIFESIGKFLKDNPMVIPAGLQLLSTHMAASQPSFDPGAAGRARAQGIAGLGDMFLQHQQAQREMEFKRKQLEQKQAPQRALQQLGQRMGQLTQPTTRTMPGYTATGLEAGTIPPGTGPGGDVGAMTEVPPEQITVPGMTPQQALATPESQALLWQGAPKQALAQYRPPKPLQPTALQRHAATVYPDDPAAQRRFIERSVMRPPVQMMPGETAEAKKLGEFRAERFGELQTEGRAASKALNNLNALEPLLEQAGAGSGTPEAVRLKRAAAGTLRFFGLGEEAKRIEGKQVPAAEAATAVSNRLTLALKNVFNLGVRGFDTPAEREFVQALSPGLGTSPEGRKILFALTRKMYQRQRDIARVAAKYERTRGTTRGLEEHLERQFSGKPVFTSADMEAASRATVQPKTPVRPELLQNIPNLQWSPSRRQYRDPATNHVYDEAGNPI